MTLYYDFNGLWSYEFDITDEDIIKAVYELYGTINDIRFADVVFKLYRRDIYNYFEERAYNHYSQTDEGKYGILNPMHLVNYGKPINICLDLKETDENSKIYKGDRKVRKSKDLIGFRAFYNKNKDKENENQMKLDI